MSRALFPATFEGAGTSDDEVYLPVRMREVVVLILVFVVIAVSFTAVVVFPAVATDETPRLLAVIVVGTQLLRGDFPAQGVALASRVVGVLVPWARAV